MDYMEAKILEAQGPIVLVVLPNWEWARDMGNRLRDQYKDLVIRGTMERIQLEEKEIQLISARSQAMKGRMVNDLIIHPMVQDLPNWDKIAEALIPCVEPGGTANIKCVWVVE